MNPLLLIFALMDGLNLVKHMDSTMMDEPLVMTHLFERAERLFPNKEIVTSMVGDFQM